MLRRLTKLLITAAAAALLAGGSVMSAEPDDVAARPLPEATAAKLPRWRGFNLPYRMRKGARPGHLNKPFTEESIRWISELGFNFVRLPLDYRYWIKGGDWMQINEDSPVLAEVDRVVEWGRKYGVHVCINFHTAPGYAVNDKTPDGSRLWSDPAAQQACALHWAFFARRYRGIPNARVSFNLWNEPNRTDSKTHLAVARLVVKAIRQEDPERLIICDGLKAAPMPELIDLGVAQAARGYNPSRITHFKASWIQGNEGWGVPTWPRPEGNGWLLAPGGQQEGAGRPLLVRGPFPASRELRLRVGDVWQSATLVVRADGRELLRRDFAAGPEGHGPWKASVYSERWKAYRSTYNEVLRVVVPAGTNEVGIAVERGHWLQVDRLEIGDDGDAVGIDLEVRWGTPASRLRFDAGAERWIAPVMQDRQWLWDHQVQPWLELAKHGVGIMIGEFGVYSRTPHDVTLAFLEDCLANYQKAGVGWALWNFDGSFGILDSGREDVDYEQWRGHQLDRQMLELLQRY